MRVGSGILRLASIAVAVFLLGCPTAAAAVERVFDPDLSLTGDCSTSALDPVPDPGLCPMPPGVPGVDHPSTAFSNPVAVTTDFYGNVYVVSFGGFSGGARRIDIFDASGHFITQVAEVDRPASLAVDSQGVLYVEDAEGKERERYLPTPPYDPEAGIIAYESAPAVIAPGGFEAQGIAVNPADDHLFVHKADRIEELSSAAEGNALVATIGEGTLDSQKAKSLAVDSTRGRVYVNTGGTSSVDPIVIRSFEINPPYAPVLTIDGSGTPVGKFNSHPTIAVDEGTGEVFVYDTENPKFVYRFESAGGYVSVIEFKFSPSEPLIAIDNGPHSPNGALNPDGRYLFVPSHPLGVGHVFAFGPSDECPASVESLSTTGLTESEAVLRAEIEPCNLATTYAIQYTSEESFQTEGFANAVTAREGTIAAAGSPVEVSVPLTGLDPDVSYRFRVLAANAKGSDEAQAAFRTYPAPGVSPPCPNEALRTGGAARLPDCRAYELVTPADTAGRTPLGGGHLGVNFPFRTASPAGDKVSFEIQNGMLPGLESTGSYAGDPFLATREQSGWTTVAAGPDGTEASIIQPGSRSPDQEHLFWKAEGGGSAVLDGQRTAYVRYPDGRSELVGRGSLGTARDVRGWLIAEDASHIVFVGNDGVSGPAVRLEPDAPPDGTNAIYDLTPDGTTHVISLLPGDQTPAAGQSATYVGASLDGEGVAFRIDGTLYLRHDNEETYEVGDAVEFAGVAEGGERIFYVEGGDLWAFDVDGEARTPFSTSGDVTPVNVAAGGSAVYFASPSVLTTEPNPEGDQAQAGAQNLYLSREGEVDFVATVTQRDVEGEQGGVERVEGLGLWVEAVNTGALARDPSRTTPDGGVLLFESRANLTGDEPGDHAQVYRYDSSAPRLHCLSCDPTGGPASGKGSLQSIAQGITAPEPFTATAYVANLRADGRRAFFQSEERLVVADVDGLQDVYEWEDQGVGSCTRPGGCIDLISSGRSARVDYLYAVSDSGDDVFFRSSDLLVGADVDETASIYDARVNGGFPPPPQPAGECLGEACQPTADAPSDQTPASSAFRGQGDVSATPSRRRCPKGKRMVRRRGKPRCVRRHGKRRTDQHRRRVAADRRPGR